MSRVNSESWKAPPKPPVEVKAPPPKEEPKQDRFGHVDRGWLRKVRLELRRGRVEAQWPSSRSLIDVWREARRVGIAVAYLRRTGDFVVRVPLRDLAPLGPVARTNPLSRHGVAKAKRKELDAAHDDLLSAP